MKDKINPRYRLSNAIDVANIANDISELWIHSLHLPLFLFVAAKDPNLCRVVFQKVAGDPVSE